jgi:hypothetical protein
MLAREAAGALAELGLLRLARVRFELTKAVLRPASRFSKHQFTQPQLGAILCLMR